MDLKGSYVTSSQNYIAYNNGHLTSCPIYWITGCEDQCTHNKNNGRHQTHYIFNKRNITCDTKHITLFPFYNMTQKHPSFYIASLRALWIEKFIIGKTFGRHDDKLLVLRTCLCIPVQQNLWDYVIRLLYRTCSVPVSSSFEPICG